MIFAALMIAAAIAATILMSMLAGSIWAGGFFLLALVAAYRALAFEAGPNRPLRRDQLNAFQQALAKD